MVELAILASLGRVRRLRFEENLNGPIRKPHLVEDPAATVDLHIDKRGEIVFDQC